MHGDLRDAKICILELVKYNVLVDLQAIDSEKNQV